MSFDPQSFNDPNAFPSGRASEQNPFGDPIPPQRSWFGRNWVWLLIATLAGSCCLCSGGIGGLTVLGFSIFKNSDPYVIALKRTQEDPRVREALGEPIIDATWMPVGSVSTHVETGLPKTGNAEFQFEVAGPKGKAHVRTKAEIQDDKWVTTQLEVEVVGGATIEIE